MNTNWYTLEKLAREHQAEMLREAETARALGGAKTAWPARLIVALCVVAPFALLLARTAAAAGALGGGGGLIHLAM